MDHERAFLQAIREEPDDDAHRLVYADWLEEQGGAARAARAAFIRAQCRLAALPADDPQRDALEDEVADLLAEHEDEWTQPLHGIAEGWEFSRGFVEHVFVRGENFLPHAESLFTFTPLRSLRLLIPPRDVPHLAACLQLPWVETLDFAGCHLNDRSLQQLLTSPHLGRLTALDLADNTINTPGMQALVRSPVLGRLRRLDLNHNLGIGDRAAHLLARAPHGDKLRTLNLGQTSLTDFGLRELFRSAHLTGLTDLYVAGVRFLHAGRASSLQELIDPLTLGRLRRLDLSNVVHGTSLAPLFAAPQIARLEALFLRGVRAARADIEAMAKSPHIASLTTLDLGQNSLGAEGTRALADSPYLTSLTVLYLGGNNIRDAGAKALADSPHLTRLRVLDLSRNGIGGPGLKALAASANLGRIGSLNLAGNFTGTDSVRALAESPHLRRLSWLNLSDGCLESDSAAALAGSANLTRLAYLFLSKNLLGDAGVRALAQSPHLRRLITLDLNDNRIGKAGAEALAAARGWRRLRNLVLGGNVFTDTQEELLRERFGAAVRL